MSPLIRGTILVALPLGIILLPTMYGKCVLKCETDSRCVGTVSKLKVKECRKIDRKSNDSSSSQVHLSVSWSKRQTNVTLSQLTQAGNVVLSLPAPQRRILCLNVTLPELTPKVLLECKHVSASTKGKRATLYDPNAHLRLARALVKRPKSTSCTCKIPYTVDVDILNGRSVRVTWKWETFNPRNMTKVEIVNSTGSPFVASVVPNTADKTQLYVVHNFDHPPGRYIAKVGSDGCQGCKRFRHSAEFQWPVPSTSTPASRRKRQHCECWTPEEVSLEPINRTNIILRWQNFYDKRDIIVGIISEDDTENFVVKEHIQSFRLKRDRIQEFNFIFNQSAGTYIGLVGSFGCARCMRYRESEPFPWNIQEPTPEPVPNTTVSTSHHDDSMSSLQIGILIAVGTMTCISVLALGIILHRRGILSIIVCQYDRVSSEHVSESDSLVSTGAGRLSDVRKVMVLRQNNDNEDLNNSADRLVRRISQRGKTVNSQTLLDLVPVTEEELILYVNVGIDVRLPNMLNTVAKKTAVVAVHNTDVHVHVPADFIFNDLPRLPNNQIHYDLDVFLNKLAPCVYILASDDDDAHTCASQQFAAVVKKLLPLKSSVVFAGDREHLSDQRANIEEWVTKKIYDATNIVVVASPQVRPTPDINGSLESLRNTTRISCSAMDKVLERDQHRARVILVSFGYWEDSLTRLKNNYFPDCQTFTLVKHVHGAVPELELGTFLKCLCSNTEVDERTCHEDQCHREFLDKVMVKLENLRTV